MKTFGRSGQKMLSPRRSVRQRLSVDEALGKYYLSDGAFGDDSRFLSLTKHAETFRRSGEKISSLGRSVPERSSRERIVLKLRMSGERLGMNFPGRSAYIPSRTMLASTNRVLPEEPNSDRAIPLFSRDLPTK